MAPLELHIKVEDPATPLVELLAGHCDLSKQCLKTALDKGALWHTRGKRTRRLRRVKTSLAIADELHLYYDPIILEREVPQADCIAAEQGYGIWYKPYGMLCQGSKWGDHCTVTRSVEKQIRGNVFLVHRLDRAATGLMVIAYGKRIAAALSEQFRQRQVIKHYQAVVHGEPAETMSLTIEQAIDDKPAISHVQVKARDPARQRAMLDVRIETGRKHQIRRHLAEAGWPIVGDRQYGIDGDKENLQLCAYRLGFTCPNSGTSKHYQLEKSRQLSL